MHSNFLSIKRQQRAERKVIGTTKGVKDRNCIRQELIEIATWPSGEPMQKVRYLHVTKGWRERVLPPLHTPLSHLLHRKLA